MEYPTVATEQSLPRTPLSLFLLSAGLVISSFVLYLGRPYNVSADVGYPAFSALQYTSRQVTAFNSLRFVDPHDLAKDIETPLAQWPPAWNALYVLAFEAGLPPGAAGRSVALILSLIGAIGWLLVISQIGLRGPWRIAGIVLASLYCVRTGVVHTIWVGDLIVYAAAPWLLVGAIRVGMPLNRGNQRTLIGLTALLCFGMGCVYWLKYSGIFLSIAVLCSLLMIQLFRDLRSRPVFVIAVAALYSLALLMPVLALKAYNFRRSGTDVLEARAKYSPLRTPARFLDLSTETLYRSSTILFSTKQGVQHIVHGLPPVFDWLIRIPGLLLLAVLLYLIRELSARYIRQLSFWLIGIPMVGFPLLTFASGPRYTSTMDRCCEPFWIFLELVVLALLSQPPRQSSRATRMARRSLAILAGIQIAFFLWFPMNAIKDLRNIHHSAAYQASAADLYIADLSRSGTRGIDAEIKGLLRTPQDILVPATGHWCSMETWMEFRGRLLPLTVCSQPLLKTHGLDGGNYESATPFLASRPLRVVVVAANPYHDAGFQKDIQRIKSRFPQAGNWTQEPTPGDAIGPVEIWMADLR